MNGLVNNKKRRTAPGPDRVAKLADSLGLLVFEFLDARSHVRFGGASKHLLYLANDEHSWCWRHRVLEAIGIFTVAAHTTRGPAGSLDAARQMIEKADAPRAEALYCKGLLYIESIGGVLARGAIRFNEALGLFKQAADLGHWWARYFYATFLERTLPEPDRKVQAEWETVLAPELIRRAASGDMLAQAEVRDLQTPDKRVESKRIRRLLQGAPIYPEKKSTRDLFHFCMVGDRKPLEEFAELRGVRQQTTTAPGLRRVAQRLLLAIRSGYVGAWATLGKTYVDLRDYAQAIRCFEEGVLVGNFHCINRMADLHLDMFPAQEDSTHFAALFAPQRSRAYGFSYLMRGADLGCHGCCLKIVDLVRNRPAAQFPFLLAADLPKYKALSGQLLNKPLYDVALPGWVDEPEFGLEIDDVTDPAVGE